MAAITLNSQQGRHVIGDMVVRFFNVTGVTTNTLDTMMHNVYFVGVQPGSAITAFTTSTSANNTTILTFTSSGAITAEVVMVIARVG